ncbi:MAG TPA: peptidylprolyl isomerase [Blastocatellia bacterium]|nr:peptidylprolyl isomerase [Blastocatellia bacterium]
MNIESETIQAPRPSITDCPAIRIEGQSIPLRQTLVRLQVEDGGSFLRQAAEAALIRRGARRLGLEVDADEAQTQADTFRRQRGLYSSQQLRDWLAQRHLTTDDWTGYLEDLILRRRLMARVAPDEEVKQHFLVNRPSFDLAEISHCVVDTDQIADEISLQIREKKRDLHYFARRFSKDRQTARLGGYLGWVRRPQINDAELESRIFGSRCGETLAPFHCQDGWRIVLVEDLRLGELDHRLETEIRESLFKDWLGREMEACEISFPIFDSKESPEGVNENK